MEMRAERFGAGCRGRKGLRVAGGRDWIQRVTARLAGHERGALRVVSTLVAA
jgi:molybdopterin-guanine dinucleotide biosynthesis protein A